MSEDNDPSRLLVTVKRTLGVLLTLFVTFLGLLLVTFVIARIVGRDRSARPSRTTGLLRRFRSPSKEGLANR